MQRVGVRLGDEVIVLRRHKERRDVAVRDVRDGADVLDVEVGLSLDASPNHADSHGGDETRDVDALVASLVHHLFAEARQVGEGGVQYHGRNTGIPVAVQQGRHW